MPTKKVLKPYNDKFDFNELTKLAIDFSDGIIEAVPNENRDMLAH